MFLFKRFKKIIFLTTCLFGTLFNSSVYARSNHGYQQGIRVSSLNPMNLVRKVFPCLRETKKEFDIFNVMDTTTWHKSNNYAIATLLLIIGSYYVTLPDQEENPYEFFFYATLIATPLIMVPLMCDRISKMTYKTLTKIHAPWLIAEKKSVMTLFTSIASRATYPILSMIALTESLNGLDTVNQMIGNTDLLDSKHTSFILMVFTASYALRVLLYFYNLRCLISIRSSRLDWQFMNREVKNALKQDEKEAYREIHKKDQRNLKKILMQQAVYSFIGIMLYNSIEGVKYFDSSYGLPILLIAMIANNILSIGAIFSFAKK